jgi:serine/threonine protein phosphatase PrpC
MRTLSDGPAFASPIVETINSVMKCGFKTRTGSVMNQPKKNNQDAFIIVPNLGGVRGNYLFGVCDGHGTNGHEVSAYVKQKLPLYLAEEFTTDYIIAEAFKQVDRELRAGPIDVRLSGTTCCVTLIKGKNLVCANCGDSRAVLARLEDRWRPIDLSTDHKADSPEENKRIIQAGGRAEPYYDAAGAPLGPHRVWLAAKDLPGLAMSRSIGDSIAASVGVTCEPELTHFSLTPQDKFVILASDGVWEFITSLEAIQLVAEEWERGNAEGCCEVLVKESLRRWRREEEVVDDITAVVVFLSVPECKINS